MQQKMQIEVTSRRDVLLGMSAATALALLAGQAHAQDAKGPASAEEAIKLILKDTKPSDAKIKLELPEIAENGNTVPFGVSVESAMTDADHIKAVHVISTGNPRPEIGSYYFNPLSGKASVSSRMRLAKTQDIVAIAEASNGQAYMTKRTVKVTIGGCGG